MEEIVALLIPLGCGCVLPILVVWFAIRSRMNETNKRTEIVLAAIEKNPEMDIEELMKKISPKKKLIKEKLLSKLLWGSLSTMLGLGLAGFGAYLGYTSTGGSDDPLTSICFGLTLLAIGIAFLINYYVGKKMLANEMEAEEKQLVKREE